MPNVKIERTKRKLEFVKSFENEDTKHYYERVLLSATEMENKLDKDLHDFDLTEIGELLESFEASPQACEVYGRIITSYVDWCIENNYKQEFNKLKMLKPLWFHKFGKDAKQMYFTDQEIIALENQCRNYQDSVVIHMLFMGIRGNALDEITNLKKDDIDYKNFKIKLLNREMTFDKSEPMDIKLFKLLEAASEQKFYLANNQTTGSRRGGDIKDLINNDYVIRNVSNRAKHVDKPVDKQIVYRKLWLLAEFVSREWASKLYSKNIHRSGMLYMAKKMMISKGNYWLDNNEYGLIGERFETKNIQTLKRIINEDTIKELYGDFLQKGE